MNKLKLFPDLNTNRMTVRLFLLLAAYLWLNGFAVALMLVVVLR